MEKLGDIGSRKEFLATSSFWMIMESQKLGFMAKGMFRQDPLFPFWW